MLWYIRNKNKVIGPFPTGHIKQAVVLGRISAHAEVSTDKEEWKLLRQCPQLIPDVLKGNPNDDHVRERLAAARRWADERRRERRDGEEDPTRTGPGRRNQESYSTLGYRDHRESMVQTLRPSRERFVIVTLFVIVILTASIYASFKWVPEQAAGPQCDAPAHQGVNWQQCNKAGMQLLNTDLNGAMLNSTKLQGANLFGSKFIKADLSYADLSNSNLSFVDFQQAQLKGANLRAADLSKANLNDADLSYADLQDAKLTETTFINTNFANTIWVDGRKCLPGSIGMCRFAK
jgi:hypothetical protein